MLDIMLKPRASTPGPTDNFWYMPSGSRTAAGINVSEESALTYSAVWAATRLLSETTAGLPLPLYRRMKNGGREQVTDDPRHLIANTQSSENITAYNFRRTIIQQQINAGNGFAEIERRGNGRFSDVVALHPICSSRVRQDPATTDLRYLVRNKDGSDVTLQPWEMLHLCGAIPKDGIWGRGVVNHGRQSIGFGLATEKHGAEFFGSGAKNIGMITTPGIKDKPQRDAMRAEWREIYQNNGDVGFFPPETKFEALGFSNEDAQFLETRQHNISEIARWYGVPPHMLAELSRSTNNNIENQSLHFVIYSLMPWIRSGEQTLNMRLLSPSEQRDMFFEHTLNGLLRGDQKSRYESYKVALGNGFMTINEVRRLENLNPIGPEGDVNYVPMNMTTAERMLSNEFTRPQPPAKSTPDSEQAFDAWTRNALKQATMPAKSARRILRAVNRIGERLAAIESKPEPQSTAPSDKQLDAARGVLRDALSRMYRKESNEAIRAAGKPESFLDWMEAFYAKHEPLMSEAIAPAREMFSALGVSIGSQSESCSESKKLLSGIYDTATKDEFSSKVSACVASWPTERTETFSRLLTEQNQ